MTRRDSALGRWSRKPGGGRQILGHTPSRCVDDGPGRPPGLHGAAAGNLTLRNEVAARFALQIIRYHPGRRTPQITCPVLFCVCDSDSVAPARATLRHARRAPRGEITTYAEGHFDIYVGAAFERVVRDQIDFLHRVVPLH